jgi:hypothetical protein
MFLFRSRTRETSRSRALRDLYRHFRWSETPEVRGQRLLRDWLSVEQRNQFDAFGYFEVVGGESGKKYRIRYGTSANVEELDLTGKPKLAWCFVPKGYLVPADIMLAQKIALETSERAALKVANRCPLASSQTRNPNQRPF